MGSPTSIGLPLAALVTTRSANRLESAR